MKVARRSFKKAGCLSVFLEEGEVGKEVRKGHVWEIQLHLECSVLYVGWLVHQCLLLLNSMLFICLKHAAAHPKRRGLWRQRLGFQTRPVLCCCVSSVFSSVKWGIINTHH